jgi:SET domain-containing protein
MSDAARARLSEGADRPGPELSPPEGLVVRHSPGRGRGVFSTRAFVAGETIEVAPVIAIESERQHVLVDTVLNSYVFGWRDSVAVALGFGSIYNHSWNPNVEYRKRIDEGVIEFVALRAIESGEELMTNYASSNPHDAGLWADLP